MFTEFVDVPWIQYKIGWLYLALVSFCLLFNMTLMFKNTIKTTKNYYRYHRKLCKAKKEYERQCKEIGYLNSQDLMLDRESVKSKATAAGRSKRPKR